MAKDPFEKYVAKIAKQTAIKMDRQKEVTQKKVALELSSMNEETKKAILSRSPAFVGHEIPSENALPIANDVGLMIETIQILYKKGK